ncbi:hypothetical protein [Thiorhodovibrio frisius]|uniref:Uncharacterized protein n=1 Tax=Thiorhodovibrio frisius TaxID=631362 RepID=H8Z609_9GAMM|nr:hypothetical protein [Thiorhodovibrio frisius]EIC20659.1 hypothetical protein Thi970DRAFT_04313 [Thiorhodovibrio frisius]WPL21407.1 hypothetical protein Thiofri_01532 [Thiorhodovibrio frisius]
MSLVARIVDQNYIIWALIRAFDGVLAMPRQIPETSKPTASSTQDRNKGISAFVS